MPTIRRTKISPRVAHAIEHKYPLYWVFDGMYYYLMHDKEQLAVRWTDFSVLLLQNNLLNREANIDPAAVTLAILAYYAQEDQHLYPRYDLNRDY